MGTNYKRSISPRRNRSTKQRRCTRQWRGSTHKLPSGLPIERMLGSRYHQGGLIHHTRLGELQTDETKTGRKVGGQHLGPLVCRFEYTVFQKLTRVAGAAVVRVAAIIRRGRLRLVGENSRRRECAILRRWQPKGQKNNCNDATERGHYFQNRHSAYFVNRSLVTLTYPHRLLSQKSGPTV